LEQQHKQAVVVAEQVLLAVLLLAELVELVEMELLNFTLGL
jgi:hypothetical protein